MAQTPTQRLANQKYAKREEKKHGKPESLTAKKNVEKPTISKGWIYVFAFLIAGGLILEILNLIFGR
ncbi:hypothetical protein POJ06DRAFT_263474 [Lipomyces tetrasporus]|uniref:Stress-associated endoplasmic reticulum protein n=1 Tax=Lipomyces tetrasporus TaxID=54092 RepID=A0AAD7QMU0_9ASCO|nr:uncharacterized protein POJ06DRAFT_263474 [Lipomyces tetrasporus]KAJ8096812.1 hypothetical protein POJ06DRAFT_263474 [Lipomyces tetrasporus]